MTPDGEGSRKEVEGDVGRASPTGKKAPPASVASHRKITLSLLTVSCNAYSRLELRLQPRDVLVEVRSSFCARDLHLRVVLHGCSTIVRNVVSTFNFSCFYLHRRVRWKTSDC